MATSDTVGAIASLSIGGTTAFFGAKIMSLELSRTVAAVNRTPLDRVSGGMTYDTGRLESWAMSGTMIFDPGQAVPLGTKGAIVLKWADAVTSTLTWSTGFLTEHSVPVAHEEGMEASFSMTLCGAAS